MAIVAKEAGEFEDIAAGIYQADFSGWEEANDGQFGPGIKIIWAGTDNKGAAFEKWQFASQKLSPKSALWAICAAFGMTPIPNTAYELDELLDPFVGQAALITIKDKGENGDVKMRVADVNPVPGAQAKKATASKAPASKETGGDTCAVEGCTDTVDHYTKKGKPLCASHDAEDL